MTSLKDKVENHPVYFALGLLFAGWVAGLATYGGIVAIVKANQTETIPTPSPAADASLNLKATWVTIPGSVPIIGGRGSIKFYARSDGDSPSDPVTIYLGTTPDSTFVGYSGTSLQVEAGDRRLFVHEGGTYAIDILALESNRAQCAVSLVERTNNHKDDTPK